jgi:hypothetical protein
VFKADPDNRDGLLMDYVLETPAEPRGSASVLRAGATRMIDYVSFETAEGTLSFAVCKQEGCHV